MTDTRPPSAWDTDRLRRRDDYVERAAPAMHDECDEATDSVARRGARRWHLGRAWDEGYDAAAQRVADLESSVGVQQRMIERLSAKVDELSAKIDVLTARR